MKRRILAVVAVAGAAYACGAVADTGWCSANGYSTSADASATLNGNSVTAVAAVPSNADDWKEKTCTNGDLFKVGNGTAVDPSVKIGTWSAQAGQVTYIYDGAGTWTWNLYQKPGGGLCWDLESGTSNTITAVTGSILATGITCL
jgi:hypothetical protein